MLLLSIQIMYFKKAVVHYHKLIIAKPWVINTVFTNTYVQTYSVELDFNHNFKYLIVIIDFLLKPSRRFSSLLK